MNKITVSIRFFAMMREIVGSPRILYKFEKNLSVLEIINVLACKFPDLKNIFYYKNKINETLVFVLNGQTVESLTRIIKADDELTILPPTGGG
ncbi:MAG: hypothetical protein HeimC2_17820 [Candidatus Heimdallarchaeota archaeon LC_2]|nr:MAG: hypothetical protein HeimC2_17820 [Candidatus Heimdallarchaeota archaeon LC_2]